MQFGWRNILKWVVENLHTRTRLPLLAGRRAPPRHPRALSVRAVSHPLPPASQLARRRLWHAADSRTAAFTSAQARNSLPARPCTTRPSIPNRDHSLPAPCPYRIGDRTGIHYPRRHPYVLPKSSPGFLFVARSAAEIYKKTGYKYWLKCRILMWQIVPLSERNDFTAGLSRCSRTASILAPHTRAQQGALRW